MSAQSTVTITIKKNENGIESEETRTFPIEEGEDIGDVLSRSGILDESGNLKDGSQFQIRIDQYGSGKLPSMNNPQSQSVWHKETRPFLGVRVKERDAKLSVCEVEPGSAAEDAGLMKGDIITEIDKKPIHTFNDFVSSIQSKEIGHVVKLTVKRGKKKKKVFAVLGERVMDLYTPSERTASMDFPMYNFRFGPDSISIFGYKNDTLKIGQLFGLNDNQSASKSTPYLGVTPFYTNEEPYESEGVRINVELETPAEKMGLVSGDVITAFNGEAIRNFNELASAVRAANASEEVRLSIIRNGKRKELKGNLGSKDCSHFDDFRIFHDFNGRDEDGNYLYNYEFDMDGEDLDKHIRDLFDTLDMSSTFDWNDIDKLFSPNDSAKFFNEAVRIEDVSDAERNQLAGHASTPMGSENDLQFETVSFFPYPAIGKLSLSFRTSSDDAVTIQLLDSDGDVFYMEKRALRNNSYNNSIDISDISAGSYFLLIQQNGKSYCKKIVKG